MKRLHFKLKLLNHAFDEDWTEIKDIGVSMHACRLAMRTNKLIKFVISLMSFRCFMLNHT